MFDGQTIHEVPFQFPDLQTQSLTWKLQILAPVQVLHSIPFQFVFTGHEHDKVTEFQVCPVAHVMHENPFQFPLGQAHNLDEAFHCLPPKQLIQATPFKLDPVGHPHDLEAAFQF